MLLLYSACYASPRALPRAHPCGVGLLINPFVCPQVGIPESRGSMCAGSMPGHTDAYSVACKYGLLCMSVFGVWRNCIFLHRARFFSHRFARHSRETRNIIITPLPRAWRNFHPRIMRARSLMLPREGAASYFTCDTTVLLNMQCSLVYFDIYSRTSNIKIENLALASLVCLTSGKDTFDFLVFSLFFFSSIKNSGVSR